MSILIKGIEMPQTGLYFVSVDNTNGRDKTVVTVERMIGNRDIRQIVGSFELVPVPPHGRLIDADALVDSFDPSDFWNPDAEDNCFAAIHVVNCAPTIIEAEGDEP